MRYKTENEMVTDLMPLILGGLTKKDSSLHCFAEVPRSSHNNHTDILIVHREKKQVVCIEFKLSGIKELAKQVTNTGNYRNQRVYTLGIINIKEPKEDKYKCFDPIFHYTGNDAELDKIIQFIHKVSWTDILESDLAGIYYWGYFNEQTNFENGGRNNCKRISMFQLYKKAIENLQIIHNWRLSFYLVYRCLGHYSITTAKKYYKEVLVDKELKNG